MTGSAAPTEALREQIKTTVNNAVWAFYTAFDRAPNEKETALLCALLTRYFVAPDAPSHTAVTGG